MAQLNLRALFKTISVPRVSKGKQEKIDKFNIVTWPQPCKLIDFKFNPIAQKISFFIWIKSSKTHSVNLFALCYNICTN